MGGTISNALSLSYYLAKDRDTLASKLMILLNSVDLLVCFSALACFLAFMITYSAELGASSVAIYLEAWFTLLVQSTAFLTSILSVTRTISVVFPFYDIRKRALICGGRQFGPLRFRFPRRSGHITQSKVM